MPGLDRDELDAWILEQVAGFLADACPQDAARLLAIVERISTRREPVVVEVDELAEVRRARGVG